jgi:hypothetical protein
MIHQHKSKANNAHLLNGYIQFHNKSCTSSTCPLKKLKLLPEGDLKMKNN